MTEALLKFCVWFSHFTYVIANSTGCNPKYVRVYHTEYNYWQHELDMYQLLHK